MLARQPRRLRLRRARARRRPNRAPERRLRRRTAPPSISPCQANRSGTKQTAARRSLPGSWKQISALAQEIQRRYERQTQNGEILTIHTLEQLDAETFQLIGADAFRRGISDHVEVMFHEAIRE